MQEPEVQIKGKISKGLPNLYWQRNLKGGPKLWKVSEFFAYPLSFVCLGFILLFSLIISLYFKIKPVKNQALSKETQEALSCYPLFLDIYPTSIYPIICKAYELALFKSFKLREPSLDMGTGDGYFTNCLYKFQDEKVTIASDLIFDTLLLSSKYNYWRKQAIIDASEIPLPDSSLRTVTMNNLIHHLPDRKEILKEVRRTLRPGGVFVFTDELLSWATSQWYLSFGKGFKWHGKLLDKFLQILIQSLISSKKFWIQEAAESGWEVLDIKEFFSSRTMFLASIFETLNLKFGKPTHKAIRGIFKRLPWLKKIQISLTRQIVEYLLKKDAELCRKHGGTFVFVALKKSESLEATGINEPDLACPVCKTALELKDNKYLCNNCHKEYPQHEGIPFLLSYIENLPLQAYIDQMKSKPLPDFYC